MPNKREEVSGVSRGLKCAQRILIEISFLSHREAGCSYGGQKWWSLGRKVDVCALIRNWQFFVCWQIQLEAVREQRIPIICMKTQHIRGTCQEKTETETRE